MVPGGRVTAPEPLILHFGRLEGTKQLWIFNTCSFTVFQKQHQRRTDSVHAFSIIYACYYIALVPFVLKKLAVYLEEPEKNAQMS